MKKYNVLISLNKNKIKLDKMVLSKKLNSKLIIKLSKEIDDLQNKIYYQV